MTIITDRIITTITNVMVATENSTYFTYLLQSKISTPDRTDVREHISLRKYFFLFERTLRRSIKYSLLYTETSSLFFLEDLLPRIVP